MVDHEDWFISFSVQVHNEQDVPQITEVLVRTMTGLALEGYDTNLHVGKIEVTEEELED